MLLIRPAVVGDLPGIVRMGLRFRAEYAAHLRENPQQMEVIARFLMTPPHLLLVAEHEHTAVGVLGAALITHPLSGDLCLSELFWWVDPEHRQGRDGLRLLLAAQEWAQAQGATTIQMVALASNPKISRLYQRLGYTARDSVWERTL